MIKNILSIGGEIMEGKTGEKKQNAYSNGLWAGDLFFMSGILGINNQLINNQDICGEMKNAFEKARDILKKEGLTLKNVISSRIYIKNIDEFVKVDETYRNFFSEPYPTRAMVEVSNLATNANIEIVLVAYRKAT